MDISLRAPRPIGRSGHSVMTLVAGARFILLVSLLPILPAILLAILLATPQTAFADSGQPGSSGRAPAAQGSNHHSVIDFDDELVEGMNRQPLDSVSQVSDAGKKKHKPHLYRKRGGFRTESLQTLTDLRNQP